MASGYHIGQCRHTCITAEMSPSPRKFLFSVLGNCKQTVTAGGSILRGVWQELSLEVGVAGKRWRSHVSYLRVQSVPIGLGMSKIFCKGPDCKYSWLLGPHSICWNCTTLLLSPEINHSQYRNKWVWLCSNNTWFVKTENGLCSAHRPQFADLALKL